MNRHSVTLRSEINKVYPDWTVVSDIGNGAGSVVFLIEKGQERRAVKVMATAKTFECEASVSRLLNNVKTFPFVNVPQLKHCGQRYSLFESEYYCHRSLGDAIKNNVCFNTADVKTIAFQLAAALSSLERVGVLHFDIKPDNILITSMNPVSVKLIDFDRCVIVSDRPTFVNSSAGTGMFMAPELLNTYKTSVPIPATASMTVWSYGVTVLDVATHHTKNIVRLKELMLFVEKIGTRNVADVVAGVKNVEGLNEFLSFIFKADPKERPSFQRIIHHEWLESVLKEIGEN